MLTPDGNNVPRKPKIRYQGRHPVFTEFQKIPSSYEPSSHRSQWTCKRCLSELSGRPQVLINHLLNTGRKNGCPYSTPDMRQQALVWQHGIKNGIDHCSPSKHSISSNNNNNNNPNIRGDPSSSSSNNNNVILVDPNAGPNSILVTGHQQSSKRSRIDIGDQIGIDDRPHFDKLSSETDFTDSILLLLQACIWDGIPFRLTENPFFRKFIRSIRPNFNLPNSTAMSTHLFNTEFSRVLNQDIELMQRQKNVTLTIDRFNDQNDEPPTNSSSSNQHLIRFRAYTQDLRSGLLLQILNVRNNTLSNSNNTNNSSSSSSSQIETNDPSHLQDANITISGPVIEVLRGKWNQFVSVCTDGSEEMVTIRKRLLESQPDSKNSVFVNCYVHSISNFCQNIFAHPLFKRVYGFVSTLLVFFRRSSAYSSELLQWGQSNRKRNFFQDLGNESLSSSSLNSNRFYMIIRLISFVSEYELGIRSICSSANSSKPTRQGGLDPKIREAVNLNENFSELRLSLKVIRPINEFIEKIEEATSSAASSSSSSSTSSSTSSSRQFISPGDLQMLILAMCFKISRAELGDSMMKQHVMNCVNKLYHEQSSVYSRTALFLTPEFREFAISKDKSANETENANGNEGSNGGGGENFKVYANTMIRTCAHWGFSREELVTMREELIRYRAGEGPYQNHLGSNLTKNGYEYWKFHPHESSLKKGAIKLFSIIPNTKSIRSMFRRIGTCNQSKPTPPTTTNADANPSDTTDPSLASVTAAAMTAKSEATATTLSRLKRERDQLSLLIKLMRCKESLRRCIEIELAVNQNNSNSNSGYNYRGDILVSNRSNQDSNWSNNQALSSSSSFKRLNNNNFFNEPSSVIENEFQRLLNPSLRSSRSKRSYAHNQLSLNNLTNGEDLELGGDEEEGIGGGGGGGFDQEEESMRSMRIDERILNGIDESLNEIYVDRLSTWNDDFDYFNFKLSSKMIEINTIGLEHKIEFLGFKHYDLSKVCGSGGEGCNGQNWGGGGGGGGGLRCNYDWIFKRFFKCDDDEDEEDEEDEEDDDDDEGDDDDDDEEGDDDDDHDDDHGDDDDHGKKKRRRRRRRKNQSNNGTGNGKRKNNNNGSSFNGPGDKKNLNSNVEFNDLLI